MHFCELLDKIEELFLGHALIDSIKRQKGAIKRNQE